MLANSRQRQQRVLEFIRGYIASNKQSPTIREIGDHVGYSSVSGVHSALKHLERRGFIRRNVKRAWRDLEIVEIKIHCPSCSLDLAVSEFGLCRARKDGQNLYCKSCCRNKMSASRRALREYRAAQNQIAVAKIAAKPELATVKTPNKLTPVDRVRKAIRRGSRTQKDIALETKLTKDEITDALAILLLWNEEIRTVGEGESRIYLIKQDEVERKPCKPAVPLFEFAKCFGPRARVKVA